MKQKEQSLQEEKKTTRRDAKMRVVAQQHDVSRNLQDLGLRPYDHQTEMHALLHT